MFSLNLLGGVWDNISGSLVALWESTGLYSLVSNFTNGGWQNLVMIAIACVLVYLAVVKKFEPLLLLPIAFGMFIVNIPGAYKILFGTKGYILTDTFTNTEYARGTIKEIFEVLKTDNFVLSFKQFEDALKNSKEIISIFNAAEVENLQSLEEAFANGSLQKLSEYGLSDLTQIKTVYSLLVDSSIVLNQTIVVEETEVLFKTLTLEISAETVIRDFGLFYYIYKGVDWVIFPPIIFLGIGVMTDFGPLIANPKSMIIGAAAQLGIFLTFFGATLFGFSNTEAAAIAIIGGADGPTAIYVTKQLAEHLLPAIAIAAYSYMALIPVIQKPIMRALTTKEERAIKMKQLRKVSKLEKVMFPLIVSLVVGLLLPDAMPLLGMLMLGNLLKESGVCGRLVDTAQNGLMNTVTIFLGVMVGSKATGALFLSLDTLGIIALGLAAFCCGTIGGLLVAKLMCKITKGQINPLIGSAGVSAVPMAARISQDVGRETDPNNHLLMHAMGPNVAGVIGSAIAAGVLLALF